MFGVAREGSMDERPTYQASTHLSVILPIFEEEESLPKLLEEIAAALRPTGLSYEVIGVDDGSSDQSFKVMRSLLSAHPELVAVRFRRNFGQTAAMQAGLDLARGDAVAFMDADLQNDPHDLPRMWRALWWGQTDVTEDQLKAELDANSNVTLGQDGPSESAAHLLHAPPSAGPDRDELGYDMIVGWRERRQDALLNRRLPSMIANRLIGWVTGVKLHDYGCSLKLIRGDLARHLKLYGEMHRFIPAIASWSGATIYEMSVNHRARLFGRSKYGIGRTIRVILDLIVVRFMQGFLVKPMQLFGLAGLISFSAGLLICVYLTAQKLMLGAELSERPLLLLGVLLLFIGVQLGSLGLIADVLARTYHESQGKTPYVIRTCLRGDPAAPDHPSEP